MSKMIPSPALPPSPAAPLMPIPSHKFGAPFAGTKLKSIQRSDRTNALYIGCLFYCFRAAAGLSVKKAKEALGMRSYPRLTGKHHIHRTRGHMRIIEAFRAHAPDVLAVAGVGDYLMAYVKYEPYTHLYNPEIMAIAQLKNVMSQTKALKLRALFNLKEPQEIDVSSKLDPNDDAYTVPTIQPLASANTAQMDEDTTEHTSHRWLLNDTSPNPVQPQTAQQAIAQERILRTSKGRELWDDLTQRDRLKLLANEAQSLPKVPYEHLWADCASDLLKKANKSAYKEIHTLPDTERTVKLSEELGKVIRAENATLRGTNLFRRIDYLMKHAP